MDSVNLEALLLICALVAFYKKSEASYFLVGGLILKELNLPFELVQDVGIILLLSNLFLKIKNHRIITVLVALAGTVFFHLTELSMNLEILEGLVILILGYLVLTQSLQKIIQILLVGIGIFLYLQLNTAIGLILILLVFLIKNLKYLKVGVPHKSKKRSRNFPQKNN